MADTVIQQALGKWLWAQQTHPDWTRGYLKQYGDPFVPWPPDETTITKEFLVRFNRYFFDTPQETIRNTIDEKKRDELVAQFNRETDRVKKQELTAETRAREFVGNLKDKIKEETKTTPPISEPAAPPDGTQATLRPISEAQLTAVIDETIRHPTAEKKYFFQALTTVAAQRPQEEPHDLVPTAEKVGEMAYAMTTTPQAAAPASFAELAKTPLQKAAAPLMDAIAATIPGGSEAAIAAIMAKPLAQVLTDTDALTQRFGEAVVSSSWYQKALSDVNRLLGEKTGASSAAVGAVNFMSDVLGFIKPPPSQEWIAVRELYYLQIVQGGPPPTAYQFYLAASSVSSGEGIFHTGLGAFRFTVRGVTTAVTRRAAKEIVSGLSTEAVGTAGGTLLGGPLGTVLGLLGTLTFNTAKNLFSKFSDWISSGALVGAEGLPVPGDKYLLLGIPLLVFLIISYMVFQDSLTTGTFVARYGGGEVGTGVFAPPGGTKGPLQCLNTNLSTGIRTPEGELTRPLTGTQLDRINQALAAYPSLGLLNCALGCPGKQINLTAYNFASNRGYWGYSPSGGGNIFFYPAAFSASTTALAKLIGHELAHQIDWYHEDVYDAFIGASTKVPGAHCNSRLTYIYEINSHEIFAEAIGLYLIGDSRLGRECPGAVAFLDTLFHTNTLINGCQK